MGSKSAFGGLAAGGPLQASARQITSGLINRFPMAANGFAHQSVSRAAPASWFKLSLLLITAGLWCLPLRGATHTNTSQFETPPLRPGTTQWNVDQRVARERQEQYRKRVLIPDALDGNVPRSTAASLVNGPKTAAAPALPPTASSGNVWHTFFVAAAFALTGVLIVQRLAPHALVDLNRLFNPWAPAPAAGTVLPARVRTEEEAFASFVKAFRVGPVASPRNAVPGEDGRLNGFYIRARECLATQRKLLHDLGRESGDPARQKLLARLLFETGVLKDEAGFPAALPAWQAASALEGLIKQLAEKVRNVTPSTLRTIAGGLDLLDSLCVPGLSPNLLTDRPLRFLVVDDDLISCQALSVSLEKAFSRPDLAGDGESALGQAVARPYDVIFLDVQMPGMDGFELCTKIRGTALNRATPVVFVTGQSDFDARCKSTLSGGNDLMGKPFLTFEVTVKALTLGLHGRLGGDAGITPGKSGQSPGPADPLPTVKDVPRPVSVPVIALRPPAAAPLPPEVDELTRAFLARASKQLDSLRELCQAMLQTPDEEMRQVMLVDGFLRVNSWLPRPALEVFHPAYQLSVVLEGLFRKMLQNPKYATPSALATMATAVDLLNDLCAPGMKADLAVHPPIRMLVVDDDLVARRSMVGALQTAFNKAESVECGEAALALAREKAFDVIFLDVMMPGMDGFEVCSRIRDTVPNRTTPVVFVTGHGDFDARALMTRNGGNGLIRKPFLTSEVTVKALTFVLRGRLQQANAAERVA